MTITRNHLTFELADNIAGLIVEQILKNDAMTIGEDNAGGFLIGTDEDKRKEWEIKYWQDWIKEVTDPWEKKFEKEMLKLFDQQMREVLANMKKTSKEILIKQDEKIIESWLFGRSTWEKRFGKIEQEMIEGIAITNGERVMGELPVVGVGFDVTNPATSKLLEARTIKVAKDIIEHTEERLRKILSTGIAAGRSIPDLKNDVEKWYKGISPDRAGKIARTETIWASNAGAEHAYVQSGVVEGKEWIVADDERLCDFCMSMGDKHGPGNSIGMGKNFAELGDSISGGKAGTYKVDYENIQWPPLHVRCRCVIAPVLKEITTETWKPAKTLKEAEERIKENRFKSIYYSSVSEKWSKGRKLNVLNTIDREMNSLANKGVFKNKNIGSLEFGYGDTDWAGQIVNGNAGYSWQASLNLDAASSKAIKAGTGELGMSKVGSRQVVGGSNFVATLRHEIGHMVKFEAKRLGKLMAGPSRRWDDLYKKLGGKNSKTISGKISKYASTDKDEFFAESFTMFTSPEFKVGTLDKVLGEGAEKIITDIIELSGKKG